MLAHGSRFDALIPPQTVAHVTDHSALILTPENSTTLSHFSTSLAMNLPKSPGEPGSGVPPTSAIRAFVLGSTKAALSSLLSFCTISAGVPFGAPTPYQARQVL
jgi:hypothetical protein